MRSWAEFYNLIVVFYCKRLNTSDDWLLSHLDTQSFILFYALYDVVDSLFCIKKEREREINSAQLSVNSHFKHLHFSD